MGLYSRGLIIGRIFESEIWGAYFREGLFLGELIIGILRYYHCRRRMTTEVKTLKGRFRFRTSVTVFEGFLSTLVFALTNNLAFSLTFSVFNLSRPNPKYFPGIILQTNIQKNVDRILVFKFHYLISIMKLLITRVFNCHGIMASRL